MDFGTKNIMTLLGRKAQMHFKIKKEKTESLKNFQNDKIKNVACSV
jgi:hypothetical protein